jgi:phosphoglycerate dehydrogenase-like enzyme
MIVAIHPDEPGQACRGGEMGLRIVALDDYQGLAEKLGLAERIAAELEAAGLGEDAAGLEVVALREHYNSEDLLAQKLAEAEVAVAMRERSRISDTLLAMLPDLRLLVTTGMRNASINLTAAEASGVTVCGTGSPATASTAELAWGLILAVMRNIPQEDASIRRGGWQHTLGRDLDGLRLGLVGFGHIGHQMAKIAAAFNMEVVAWSPNLDPEVAAAAGVRAVTKEELFSTSDVVSIHLVLSVRTRHIIADSDLKQMKPTAILINTSRWAIVKNSALARMMTAGTIAGVGIDVWHAEPMLPNDPWRNAPRSVLTPHLGYVTERTMEYWYGEIAQDIAAWRSGEPVRVLMPAEDD